jgi:phosphohistidine phosphatase
MKLFLVQHAEAKPKQDDPDRPLSDQGQADIQKVAAYVATHASGPVERIIHSGKTRAKQTAEILARALTPVEGVSESPDLAPLAEPDLWGSRLSGERKNLMLVGHLPHLSKLAAQLVCQQADQQIVNFQMAGVVRLGRDEAGVWVIDWVVTPEIVV